MLGDICLQISQEGVENFFFFEKKRLHPLHDDIDARVVIISRVRVARTIVSAANAYSCDLVSSDGSDELVCAYPLWVAHLQIALFL